MHRSWSLPRAWLGNNVSILSCFEVGITCAYEGARRHMGFLVVEVARNHNQVEEGAGRDKRKPEDVFL